MENWEPEKQWKELVVILLDLTLVNTMQQKQQPGQSSLSKQRKEIVGGFLRFNIALTLLLLGSPSY